MAHKGNRSDFVMWKQLSFEKEELFPHIFGSSLSLDVVDLSLFFLRYVKKSLSKTSSTRS